MIGVDATAAAYHSDTVSAVPTLSSGIAHILCSQSPRHAWTAHPRLNPDWQPDEDAKFDVGNIAHRILLEGTEDGLHIVDAPDWRTKDARDARDAARARGLTPLLAGQVAAVRAMAAAAREQLAAHQADPPLFTAGTPESVLVWTEPNGVVCRAKPDWLRHDLATIDDLKSTSRSAHPDSYARALFGVGGDIQSSFYMRGVHALTGAEPRWRWVVLETYAPFALSVIEPSPAMLTLGHAKVERAIRIWHQCLERHDWPAYPTRVATVDPPPWEEARWLERELEEEAAA